MSEMVERMFAIQAEHERAEREDPLHWAQVARSVAALGDDEDLMWHMGVREWEIAGRVSHSLRAEVVRQSSEHVQHLVDALSERATQISTPSTQTTASERPGGDA